MTKKHVSTERLIEETIEFRKADFSRHQKRMIELIDIFKNLNVEEIDPMTLLIYAKSFPEAVDCIEDLCDSLTKRGVECSNTHGEDVLS